MRGVGAAPQGPRVQLRRSPSTRNPRVRSRRREAPKASRCSRSQGIRRNEHRGSTYERGRHRAVCWAPPERVPVIGTESVRCPVAVSVTHNDTGNEITRIALTLKAMGWSLFASGRDEIAGLREPPPGISVGRSGEPGAPRHRAVCLGRPRVPPRDDESTRTGR